MDYRARARVIHCPYEHKPTQLILLLVVPHSPHLSESPPSRIQLLLKTESLDLLLHLPDLEAIWSSACFAEITLTWRTSHGLRGRDQPLCPEVVAFVELLHRARPFSLCDDLLLRCRGTLNEPPNGVRDSERGLQDRIVHLHLDSTVPYVLRLGHELLQLLCGSLDRPRSAQHLLLDDTPNLPVHPHKIAPLVFFCNKRLNRFRELAENPM